MAGICWQAMVMADRLAQTEGLLVGPPSSATVHAALALASTPAGAGKTVVVLLPRPYYWPRPGPDTSRTLCGPPDAVRRTWLFTPSRRRRPSRCVFGGARLGKPRSQPQFFSLTTLCTRRRMEDHRHLSPGSSACKPGARCACVDNNGLPWRTRTPGPRAD
jgi:hypothetical protein